MLSLLPGSRIVILEIPPGSATPKNRSSSVSPLNDWFEMRTGPTVPSSSPDGP